VIYRKSLTYDTTIMLIWDLYETSLSCPNKFKRKKDVPIKQ